VIVIRNRTTASHHQLNDIETQSSESSLHCHLISATIGAYGNPVDELLRNTFIPRVNRAIEFVQQRLAIFGKR
jgi:hypothetical protein